MSNHAKLQWLLDQLDQKAQIGDFQIVKSGMIRCSRDKDICPGCWLANKLNLNPTNSLMCPFDTQLPVDMETWQEFMLATDNYPDHDADLRNRILKVLKL